MGSTRQLFGAGCLPLFDEKLELTGAQQNGYIEIKNIAKISKDTYSHIAELEKDRSRQVNFISL
jgi:hypothetical protein